MTSGSAVVIGASGQIGRAAVRALARDGWEVRAASRRGGRDDSWPGEVRAVAVDRADDAALAGLIGEGCDVLLDCVAYGAGHARQLTYEESLPATVASLADRVQGRDWWETFPTLAGLYPDEQLFGYAAEDRWLAERGGKR